MARLRTRVAEMLGAEHAILSVGFGRGAGPELAAAVSNAGGFGVIGGSGWPERHLRERIARTRALTSRPFGVNLIIQSPQDEQLRVCLDERVRAVVLFWGDPAPYVAAARGSATRLLIQVGSVEEARAAARAGVDAIIAQGNEAGGHVRGRVALATLVPAVVETVRPIPVLASGGIADGRGIAAALALGAEGVSLGTRFVASREAYVVDEYKERLIAATAEDTVYGTILDIGWPGAPGRTLRNAAVREWEAAGGPAPGGRPREGEVIGRVTTFGETSEIRRWSVFMRTPDFAVSPDEAPLWAGQSVELVRDIRPAGEIVRDLVREAEAVPSRA